MIDATASTVANITQQEFVLFQRLREWGHRRM